MENLKKNTERQARLQDRCVTGDRGTVFSHSPESSKQQKLCAKAQQKPDKYKENFDLDVVDVKDGYFVENSRRRNSKKVIVPVASFVANSNWKCIQI